MANTSRIAIYLISLFLGLSSFTGRHRVFYPDYGALSPARQRLLRIALSHVGICEATGHDDGPEIERFQRATGNYHEAWCSSHCVACYKEAHLAAYLPPWVNGAANSWFHKGLDIYANGHWLAPDSTSHPGDVLGYYNNHGPGRVRHVGLQASEWGDKPLVYDVEGNYGGCVKIVLRPKRVIGRIVRCLP